MRHIGTIAEQKQAERFVHFLASQHIEAELGFQALTAAKVR